MHTHNCHKMVLDLKLSRLQDVPWGFRLAGGADYDLPLTVIKVRLFSFQLEWIGMCYYLEYIYVYYFQISEKLIINMTCVNHWCEFCSLPFFSLSFGYITNVPLRTIQSCVKCI